MTVLALCSVLVLVAVNALFVATEFALVAARPSALAEAAEGGSRAAARALRHVGSCGCRCRVPSWASR